LLFHRWGGLGNHRYQVGFSGDTLSTWQSLAYLPYFTATASNVCYGYWSHDIGGHFTLEKTTNPELYLRWLQFGIFSPILRTHATKSAYIERRFWKFPDHFTLMRKAIHLRYALIPYIYHAARQAYDTGLSICRPMYYDYPEHNNAYQFKSQYMFGNDMIVAPIVQPISEKNQLASQKVWLPGGDWYEWFSGTLLNGDRVIQRQFSLSEIPVYVRAGAIIPMYPKIKNLQQKIDSLVLTIIPGNETELKFYEDDGVSLDYQQHKYSITKIETIKTAAKNLKITIHPAAGNYKNMIRSRSYEIRLPRTLPPCQVLINGKLFPYSYELQSASWSYRGWELMAYIRTPKFQYNEKIDIEIFYNESNLKFDHLLNGKIGVFRRLADVVSMLKFELARKSGMLTVPDDILHLEQTPTRIDYSPEETLFELQQFEAEYAKINSLISRISDIDKKVRSRILAYLI